MSIKMLSKSTSTPVENAETSPDLTTTGPLGPWVGVDQIGSIHPTIQPPDDNTAHEAATVERRGSIRKAWRRTVTARAELRLLEGLDKEGTALLQVQQVVKNLREARKSKGVMPEKESVISKAIMDSKVSDAKRALKEAEMTLQENINELKKSRLKKSEITKESSELN